MCSLRSVNFTLFTKGGIRKNMKVACLSWVGKAGEEPRSQRGNCKGVGNHTEYLILVGPVALSVFIAVQHQEIVQQAANETMVKVKNPRNQELRQFAIGLCSCLLD